MSTFERLNYAYMISLPQSKMDFLLVMDYIFTMKGSEYFSLLSTCPSQIKFQNCIGDCELISHTAVQKSQHT